MTEAKRTIEPGKYLTKPTGWGLAETKNGFPQVYVNFDINLTYYGVIANEDSCKYIAQNLVLLGFKGNDLGELDDQKALNKDRAVHVVVEIDEKYGPKIKYINDPDYKGNINKLSKSEFSTKHNVKMDGFFAEARQEASANPSEQGTEGKNLGF